MSGNRKTVEYQGTSLLESHTHPAFPVKLLIESNDIPNCRLISLAIFLGESFFDVHCIENIDTAIKIMMVRERIFLQISDGPTKTFSKK